MLLHHANDIAVGPCMRILPRVVGSLLQPSKLPNKLRHHRYGRVIDEDSLTMEESDALPTLDSDKTFFYGGTIPTHFGHFIAEFTSRLWALEQIGEPLTVLFTLSKGLSEPPDFFDDVMDYLGITDIKLIAEPCRVKKLIIAEQGKSMGKASSPEHTAFLEMVAQKNQLFRGNSVQKLAITRGHIRSRRLIGELALEKHLLSEGYQLFRPEDHSILKQLKTLANARKLIIADGSACHLFDLLPKTNIEAFYYSGNRQGDIGGTSVLPKVKSLHRFEKFKMVRLKLYLDGLMVWKSVTLVGSQTKLGLALKKAGFIDKPLPALNEKDLAEDLKNLPQVFDESKDQNIQQRLKASLLDSPSSRQRIADVFNQPLLPLWRRLFKRFRR